MNANDLAESMLDGSLGYEPDDDACFIAKAYLDLLDAESVAEVTFISKLFEGVTCVPLACKTELKIGDKLYLRKE